MTRLSASDELRARFSLAVGCANWALATNAREDFRIAEQLTREILFATVDYREQDAPLRAVGGSIFNSALLLLACLWTRTDVVDDDGLLKRVGLPPRKADSASDVAERVENEWRSAPSVAYRRACYCTAIRDYDSAFAELAVALQMPVFRAWASTDPWLTPLHGHPRWAELIPPQALQAEPLAESLGEAGSIIDAWALLGRDARKAASVLATRDVEPLDTMAREVSLPDDTLLQRLEHDVLRSELLFTQGHLDEAAETSAGVLEISENRLDTTGQNSAAWGDLELEALRTHAVSLALSGNIDDALQLADRVRDLASRTRSVKALKAESTLANISLAKDPTEAEETLRRCLRSVAEDPADDDPAAGSLWAPLRVNLAMALLLQGAKSGSVLGGDARKLSEAMNLLAAVYDRSIDHGQHGHAAAAALLAGIVYAVRADRETAVLWFERAVRRADRAGHVETGWRSHVNLACALYQHEGVVSKTAASHARTALKLMEPTIPSRSDQTPRFRLLAVPMAHAVRLLILAGAREGWAAVEQYPSLRRCFTDVSHGIMREERGGFTSHEWVRVADIDYVIY